MMNSTSKREIPPGPSVTKHRRNRAVLMLSCLLVAALLVSVGLGTVPIGPLDSARLLLGLDFHGEESARLIFWQLRLPRVTMAIVVGAALGSVGASLQSLLRNPLADPYLLGISSGAGLGAVLAIGLGKQASAAFAFAGAMGAMGLVFTFARRRQRLDPHTLILAGVVLNALFGAAIVLVLIFLQPEQVQAIVFWLLGTVRSVSWTILSYIGATLALGLGLLLYQARPLDLMAQGDDTAQRLGVHTERCKLIVLAASAILTSLAVAFNGLIGFVGLIVPHVGRFLFGPDNRVLLPASALIGALTMLIADTLARSLMSPTELPVGAVTAVAGAPFFLFLLRRGGKTFV